MTIVTAAASGDLKSVEQFLAADPKAVSATNEFGLTPLHGAAAKGRLDVVKVVIGNKASVDSRDERGGTPLWYAAISGKGDVVQFLVSKGANFILSTGPALVA